MRVLISAALLLATPLAFAAPADLTQSRIGFAMKQLGTPVDGGFKSFSANVELNPAKPEAGKADITIQTGSISLPTRDAEAEAKKKEWFNAGQFPTARFVSSSIKSAGPNRYQVTGKLTLKGITRDVSAPFTLKQQGALSVVEGVLPVSRLAFKIGEGDWTDTGTVADEVQIKFRVAFPAATK
ncbi:YceI family protein [Pseudogulbenkiania sp. NH8B]|uniref:YceI family protein n=1 Tax=Pseudogulbenkiania sp. (strain NH8B) TaxID=748280 RepID=UPI00022793FC|nr:YceI family protein [Pseudogulbenkiania sp. NH8B]BAK75306.1 YceI family protein [Pseudogulbenkiania sp. NH8B]